MLAAFLLFLLVGTMYEPNHQRVTYDAPLLTKAFEPLEVRAKADEGIVSGVASKFWCCDSYAEVTAPGSFQKSVADRGPNGANRIPLRYEHSINVGTHRELYEDSAGLHLVGHVSDDGMDGTRVRRHLGDGLIYGISIGFRRISDRTATDDDPIDLSSAPEWVQRLPRNEIRVLTEIKLMENSLVAFPACDPATVESYRSDAAINALLRALTSRKLSPVELAQLKAFIDAQPADVVSRGGETPPAESMQTALLRNRHAEFELIRADLARLGVTA